MSILVQSAASSCYNAASNLLQGCANGTILGIRTLANPWDGAVDDH